MKRPLAAAERENRRTWPMKEAPEPETTYHCVADGKGITSYSRLAYSGAVINTRARPHRHRLPILEILALLAIVALAWVALVEF